MSWLSDTLGTSRPGSPNLPGAPKLEAAVLPQYPGFSPEEINFLQQRRDLLGQYQSALNAPNTPYEQQSGDVALAELQRYQNALAGNVPVDVGLQQQKSQDWERLKEQAGQLGIQLSGDRPESAASSSTAGNQMILDFNKRYGYLEDQVRQQTLQSGYSQNLGRLGFGLQSEAQQLGGLESLGSQYAGLGQPYEAQRLGQFGVGTQQALTNADIANQNKINKYQAALAQSMANYQSQLGSWQGRMGLLSGGLQLAGTGIGAMMGGAPGAMIGGQAGSTLGGMFSGGGGGMGGGGSWISPMAYSQMGQQQPYYNRGYGRGMYAEPGTYTG